MFVVPSKSLRRGAVVHLAGGVRWSRVGRVCRSGDEIQASSATNGEIEPVVFSHFVWHPTTRYNMLEQYTVGD